MGEAGRLTGDDPDAGAAVAPAGDLLDAANLDEGAMWPTGFALKTLTAAEEARIGALVKQAVS